jgi:hypothetical protein
MWYYPVYETPNKGLTIAAVLEYDEDDIQYEPAPVKGFDDDRYITVGDVVQHAYMNKVENYFDDYYLEPGYNGEPTLIKAQQMLVKYIF